MEEGSLSRTLAFDCGHGYAPEQYATKRQRGIDITLFTYLTCPTEPHLLKLFTSVSERVGFSKHSLKVVV